MVREQLQTGFFLRKIPVCLLIKQVSWLTARRALHLLTAHCLHGNGIRNLLPVYSDRIARELHPIPSNQTESGHLLKTYMKEL